MRASVMKAQANQAKKTQMINKGSLAKGDSSQARKKRAKVIEETYGHLPLR